MPSLGTTIGALGRAIQRGLEPEQQKANKDQPLGVQPQTQGAGDTSENLRAGRAAWPLRQAPPCLCSLGPHDRRLAKRQTMTFDSSYSLGNEEAEQ